MFRFFMNVALFAPAIDARHMAHCADASIPPDSPSKVTVSTSAQTANFPKRFVIANTLGLY